jgi:hypothetical protein
MIKGFLHEKCMVLQYKLYVQGGSSFQHLIVARHRHGCRCHRYRHSGIHSFVGYRSILVPDWVHLFHYRTCSSISFFHSGTSWTGCCTLQDQIFVKLTFSPIFRFSSVHCIFNGRLSGQFSGSQASFGTTLRGTIGYRKAGWNKLPEEGHWKDFHNQRFHQSKQNLYFGFISQKTAKKCENPQRSYKKNCFDYQDLKKKIFIQWHDTIPLIRLFKIEIVATKLRVWCPSAVGKTLCMGARQQKVEPGA